MTDDEDRRADRLRHEQSEDPACLVPWLLLQNYEQELWRLRVREQDRQPGQAV